MSIHVTPPPGSQSRPLAAFDHLVTTNQPNGPREPLRAALEAHIEACIALLDAIDGDPEAENNGDLELEPDVEPSLGAYEGQESQVGWGSSGNDQDLEFDAGDHGIGDRDGLYEQGHVAGLGLMLLREEGEACRRETARLAAIIARLSGVETKA